jgi:hypothetical protein
VLELQTPGLRIVAGLVPKLSVNWNVSLTATGKFESPVPYKNRNVPDSCHETSVARPVNGPTSSPTASNPRNFEFM